MQDNVKIDETAVENVDNANKKGKAVAKETKPPTHTTRTTKTVVKQAFMYLGPNIPGGTLFNGSLFKCKSVDEIKHLKDLFEKIPEVKKLFVEVKKVSVVRKEVSTQGTEAYRLQQAIKIKIKEGVLKNGI